MLHSYMKNTKTQGKRKESETLGRQGEVSRALVKTGISLSSQKSLQPRASLHQLHVAGGPSGDQMNRSGCDSPDKSSFFQDFKSWKKKEKETSGGDATYLAVFFPLAFQRQFYARSSQPPFVSHDLPNELFAIS